MTQKFIIEKNSVGFYVVTIEYYKPDGELSHSEKRKPAKSIGGTIGYAKKIGAEVVKKF